MEWWDELCAGGRLMKHHPKFFIVLIGIASVGWWFFWTTFYENRIVAFKEIIENNKETLYSYRIKIGEEKPEKTSLMESTDADLKKRAGLLVNKIKQFTDIHERYIDVNNDNFKNKIIDEKEHFTRERYEFKRAAKQFHDVWPDTFMLIDEIRRRIPKEQSETVPTMGVSSEDYPETSAQLDRAFVDHYFSVNNIIGKRLELDELAKLLPGKLGSCRKYETEYSLLGYIKHMIFG
jgi:hypothetical protein